MDKKQWTKNSGQKTVETSETRGNSAVSASCTWNGNIGMGTVYWPHENATTAKKQRTWIETVGRSHCDHHQGAPSPPATACLKCTATIVFAGRTNSGSPPIAATVPKEVGTRIRPWWACSNHPRNKPISFPRSGQNSLLTVFPSRFQ